MHGPGTRLPLVGGMHEPHRHWRSSDFGNREFYLFCYLYQSSKFIQLSYFQPIELSVSYLYWPKQVSRYLQSFLGGLVDPVSSRLRASRVRATWLILCWKLRFGITGSCNMSLFMILTPKDAIYVVAEPSNSRLSFLRHTSTWRSLNSLKIGLADLRSRRASLSTRSRYDRRTPGTLIYNLLKGWSGLSV